MAMKIVNNMSAVRTLNTLNANSDHLAKSLQKVSSGMKINSAADDASGYSISERMRVQIRGLEQADSNTQNGINLLRVAEGAVSSTVDILKTLKEKVVNAANDTNTDVDRQTIQKELNQSVDQINDNANVTFNGKVLIDGSHNSQVVHDRNGRVIPGANMNYHTARTYGRGTYTHLTNSSLAKDTTWLTTITDLKDRNGESLNIQSDDTLHLSFVQEGKTYTTSFQVGTKNFAYTLYTAANAATYGNTQVDPDPLWDGLWCLNFPAESFIGHDASGNDVYTADGENALSLMAGGPGLQSQIAGFTISVTDTEGNIKKSATAVLDDWRETIRAQEESEDNSLTLQVGTKANQSIKVGFTDMRARALGLQGADGAVLNISTQVYANAAISVMDFAIQRALDEQTKIGSIQSRLEYTSANLTTAAENVTASESTIRDADMAKEMTEYTKHNLLLQASQSMLSQANQSASNVLSLLQ
ncbi:MAG: flagellin [Selenomonadaceae bacterium]|nr:flagellin [Selenomonadaceae bacterium]